MIEEVFQDGLLYSDFVQINAGRWEAMPHHPSSPVWVLTRTTKGWRLRGLYDRMEGNISLLFPGRNGLERHASGVAHREAAPGGESMMWLGWLALTVVLFTIVYIAYRILDWVENREVNR